MEGWRQRRLDWAEKSLQNEKIVEKSKKLLTGVGLLMEGAMGCFLRPCVKIYASVEETKGCEKIF
jgi:hypothetical protein